ncbi:unnamed protein product, partial [Rotaria magnacalcarata]
MINSFILYLDSWNNSIIGNVPLKLSNSFIFYLGFRKNSIIGLGRILLLVDDEFYDSESTSIIHIFEYSLFTFMTAV